MDGSNDALQDIREEEDELDQLRKQFIRGLMTKSYDQAFAAVERLTDFRIRQALRRKGI